jgi:oxygen-independent coproporphyrinogen-3 oxidase
VAFGVYVHVPWCASRCGYCNFNTYVPRGDEPSAFAATALAEIALMRAELGEVRPETVFFGGGTPTLVDPADLGAVLAALDPAPGAEVTVEANPETVDEPRLAALREAGFTRVSIGMQSAAGHVLKTLDRAHTPGRATAAAREARAAGFEHVSLDLIYGTPGESDADWRGSVEAALGAEPDHVSAYGLIVEPGTALAAAVRSGRLPVPDEDALARRYAIADDLLEAGGLGWYEICNWAATDAARCRHNLNYWAGGDWWAIGPGAHGHMGGERFWTHKHPATHAAAVAAGELPIAGREVLDGAQVELERVMLGVRLREGIVLREPQRRAAASLRDDGLVSLVEDRAVLTGRGRRLADVVIRGLV